MSYFASSDQLPEWARQIPRHWGKDWLKWSVSLSTIRPDEGQRTTLPYLSNEDIASWTGKLLREELEPFDADSRLFETGDVLFNKLRPYLAKVFHANFAGTSSGELLCLRPSSRVNARYLFYVLTSFGFIDAVDSHSFGSKMPRADWETVGHQPLPLPDIEVQQRIANFLDEKTARIDALIEKKKALLERLVEKRQALITRAVTKGLNPDVPMKPSGVNWLGDIPAHWDLVPLRRMVDLVRGHDLPQQDRVEGDVVVVSSAGKSGTHDTAACQGPGIVTGRYGTIGRFYLLEGPFWPLNTTLYSRALNCDPIYGLRMLEAMAHLFLLNAMKSAVPGVDRNDLASEYTPRPPTSEQREISEYLEIGLERLRQSQTLIATSVERLSEHRSALITAAVTGQLPELNG